MFRNNINMMLMWRIIINKLFNNKCYLKYKDFPQTKWCRLKLFIIMLLLCMRSACFSAKKKFFFKISLWLVDEELYISWIFIEHETFIEFDRVFIKFCAFSAFCRRNCNVIIYTFLKYYMLCQLLSSMQLLI